jgi:aminopeptidase
MLPRVVTDDVRERLAQLAVELGANVQPGQLVGVSAETGQEAYARAIAEAAYRRGARYVDVRYFDSYVKRLRLLHAPEETLDYVPGWLGERVRELSRERGAAISLAPPVTPGLLAGVDPARAGRDRLPVVKETLRMVNDRTVNWTALPAPTAAWARVVHGDGDDALERLSAELVHVLRLDEDDPVAAWQARMAELDSIAGRLTALSLDAVHFEGPGTDLTIGLLPTSRWASALFTTVDGIQHLVNVPSEEVFTAPDPERVDGVVRATRPLELHGAIVEGLVVRFEGGRATEIEAERNAAALRARCAVDEGAARLGEVALVDRHGRVGSAGTTFYDTLLDENAASHLALGNAYEFTVAAADRERINMSAIHVDFMVGAADVEVSGLAEDGARVPLLRGGDWQI